MPVDKDADSYNMNHKRRGIAIIFNHKNFDPRLGLKTRNGTDADRDNLKMTLRQLDFDVKVFDDLPLREIVSSIVLFLSYSFPSLFFYTHEHLLDSKSHTSFLRFFCSDLVFMITFILTYNFKGENSWGNFKRQPHWCWLCTYLRFVSWRACKKFFNGFLEIILNNSILLSLGNIIRFGQCLQTW